MRMARWLPATLAGWMFSLSSAPFALAQGVVGAPHPWEMGMQHSYGPIKDRIIDLHNLVLAIINDGRWNMVHHGFRKVFGRLPQGLPQHVADLAGVAREFGAIGVRVDTPDDLRPERLQAAASQGRPVVLDIRIDPSLALSVESRSAALQEFAATGGDR